MNRSKLRCLAAAMVTGAAVAAPAPGARAQNTSNLSQLYLSNGSELDFGLYGANGGTSDKLVVQNAFNYSSASPGTYFIGFSHNDASPLTPGSTFTLVTFGSTNFAPADASHFQAVPEGTLSSIDGIFSLNAPSSGTPGSLQFTLISSTETPEPSSALFLLLPLFLGSLCTAQRLNQVHTRLSFLDETTCKGSTR